MKRTITTEYVINTDIYTESSAQFSGIHQSLHAIDTKFPNQDVLWLNGNRGYYESLNANLTLSAFYYCMIKNKNQDSYTVVPVMRDFKENGITEDALYPTLITDSYSRTELINPQYPLNDSCYSSVLEDYKSRLTTNGVNIIDVQFGLKPIEEIIITDVAIIRSQFHRIKYTFEYEKANTFTRIFLKTFGSKLLANYQISNSVLPLTDWNTKFDVDKKFTNKLHVEKHISETLGLIDDKNMAFDYILPFALG